MAKATSKTTVGTVDYSALEIDQLHELGNLLIPGFEAGDYTKAGLPAAIARQAKKRKLDSEDALTAFIASATDKAWGKVDDEEEREQTYELVMERLKKCGSRVDKKKYSEDSEQDRVTLIKLLHRRRNITGNDWSLDDIDEMTATSGTGGRPIPIAFDISDGFESIETDVPDGVTKDAVEMFEALYEIASSDEDELEEAQADFECGRSSLDGKRPVAIARWRGMTVSMSLPMTYTTAE